MCPLHPAAVIVSAVQRHPWVFLTSDSRLFVLLSVLQKKKKKKWKQRRNQRGREYFLMVRRNTFIIDNNPPLLLAPVFSLSVRNGPVRLMSITLT